MNNWNDTIANLMKMDVDQMALTEKQKEARKEFIDATKELFGNHDERKASVHLAKLTEILLLNHEVSDK